MRMSTVHLMKHVLASPDMFTTAGAQENYSSYLKWRLSSKSKSNPGNSALECLGIGWGREGVDTAGAVALLKPRFVFRIDPGSCMARAHHFVGVWRGAGLA